MIFNVCGFWGEDVVGVGVTIRVWGDRACQSGGLTDMRAVGTGDRGHPRPSWANLGAFYGFIKLLTPITPWTGNALADEWRDHVNEDDGAWDKRLSGGESCEGGEDEQGGSVGELGGLRWRRIKLIPLS